MTNILTSTGLVQHVTGPTHRSSHTLNTVISRKEDILTSPTAVLPNTFSNHHTITFSIEGHTPRPSTNKCREYRHVDLDIFRADLHVTLTSRADNDGETVDDVLLQSLHSVSNTLDTHAPVVSGTRKSTKRQPWFDDVTLNLRCKSRALERKWRKTGQVIDKQVYLLQTYKVKQHVGNAKIACYGAALNNADAKTTFQMLHSLTNSSDRKLPDHENDESMRHDFAEFFEERVHQIIDVTIARVTTESVEMPLLPAAPPVSHALNDLCPTDNEELQTIIQSRPTKCCSLDMLPTWLLKLKPKAFWGLCNNKST